MAWLDQLTPADRVTVCRLLADRSTYGTLAALADATVYEATRGAKAAEVAQAYGLTARQVQRAVANYNERMKTDATV